MPNQRHAQPPPSKPITQAGIRPPDLEEFTQRFNKLDQLVRDAFDERNQWNSKVREWLGKQIKIRLMDSCEIIGVLQWVDRYTICVQEVDVTDVTIVHKGAVATINYEPE